MKKNINKKSNKKYQLVKAAKNKIVAYDWILHDDEVKDLIKSCKGRTLKKYVKHVLRSGEFYEEKFLMPTTALCMDLKVKKRPLIFLYEDDINQSL